MGSDVFEIIALCHKVGIMGCLVYKGGDIAGYYMDAGVDKAEEGCDGAALSDDAAGPAS
jgi:hypothetical protein